VRRRVTELAEKVIAALSSVEIGRPVAGKVAELIRRRCEDAKGRFGVSARGFACGEKNRSLRSRLGKRARRLRGRA
jgi:hypothetical protein